MGELQYPSVQNAIDAGYLTDGCRARSGNVHVGIDWHEACLIWMLVRATTHSRKEVR